MWLLHCLGLLKEEEEILFSSNLERAPSSLFSLSRPIYSLIDDIKSENQRNSEVQNMFKKYDSSDPNYDNFRVRSALFYNDKYFVTKEFQTP